MVSQFAEILILFMTGMVEIIELIKGWIILLHSKVYINKDIDWFTHWAFFNHSKFIFAILLNVNNELILRSPVPRIKVENPSTPTLDNPSHPHPDNPSKLHPYEQQSMIGPGANPWGGSDRQQTHGSASGLWNRQHSPR